MRGLGLLIGIILLLSKLTRKKPIDPKTKKFSPVHDDDRYTSESENAKSNFHDYEKNSDITSKEVNKKSREDRKKRIEVNVFSEERQSSEITSSSRLFENSKDLKKELVKSIIYSEVIAKPKSLRR